MLEEEVLEKRESALLEKEVRMICYAIMWSRAAACAYVYRNANAHCHCISIDERMSTSVTVLTHICFNKHDHHHHVLHCTGLGMPCAAGE